MSFPSYYFTLYQKFQILGHVPYGTYHGGGAGGFFLANPEAPFGSSKHGTLLDLSNIPDKSPLWAILNSRAMGNPGFASVKLGGILWPTMPDGEGSEPPAWADFQVNAPAPGLVQVFADWIIAGKVKDIPYNVIAQMPPPIKRLTSDIGLFVCSTTGDDGFSAVPANFWATSLIFLVDPSNGSIVDPGQLHSTDEYYLTAIIGNRSKKPYGQYADESGKRVQSQAWVMAWNSGMGPAFQLPALSNLDIQSTQGNYETYHLKAGSYDVIGFRLNVQTVFDGLVKAIKESDVDLGGLTAEQWVHAKDAHLCAKVMVRREGQFWPSLVDTPFTNRRIAQRNLAPFNIDLSVKDPDPNIYWKNFMIGDTHALSGFDDRLGIHTLKLQSRLSRQAFRIYLAMPQSAFTHLKKRNAIRGFEFISDWPEGHPRPFPDAIILRYQGGGNQLIIPPIGERSYLAMSLGIEYQANQLQPGYLGEVSILQETTVPEFDPMSNHYEIVQSETGGFTITVQGLPG